MQVGMIGLGRMGANLVKRAARAGHEFVVYDASPDAVQALVASERAHVTGTDSLAVLVAKLKAPRVIWLMVPAQAVDAVLRELAPHLERGDTLIDGGNSHYQDDLRRARELAARGVHYVDVGTSGGVWGLERGYCLMIGGEAEVVKKIEPLFVSLAPGVDAAYRTLGSVGTPSAAEQGYLHCGPAGAGHFVKMIHNGIEYGMMAAYAEGLNLLRHAGLGLQDPKRGPEVAREAAALRDPAQFQYSFALDEITELWRRGSVIGSWLLDLTAQALREDPTLSGFGDQVSDSGEGRWTVETAIEAGVPAPVLTAALYSRFASRDRDEFANQVLSAMRKAFGGHVERLDRKQ